MTGYAISATEWSTGTHHTLVPQAKRSKLPTSEMTWQVTTSHGRLESYRRFDGPQALSPPKFRSLAWTADVASFLPPAGDDASERQYAIIRNRLGDLLAEAAHDVRSPLAAASQIISSVANRVRGSSLLPPSDVELLDSANYRLLQANTWVQGILAERRLDRPSIQQIRSRFYPLQWQQLLGPLLDSLAHQQQVKLDWQGWDRSLPKLYVDANLLSRVILNLVVNAIRASEPNHQVRIAVAWTRERPHRLQLQVADQAGGLAPELANFVNSPQMEMPGGIRGLGLKTAKSLMRELGGELTAQVAPNVGTQFLLSLPIDDLRVQIRHWLLRCARHRLAQAQTQDFRAQIELVRVASPIDLSEIDSTLQHAAEECDFIYRIAKDRWLWFSIADEDRIHPAEELTHFLSARGGKSTSTVLHHRTYRSRRIDWGTWSNQHSHGFESLTQQLTQQAMRSMGDIIPPVDALVPGGNSNREVAEASELPNRNGARRTPIPTPKLPIRDERSQAHRRSVLERDADVYAALKDLAAEWQRQSAAMSARPASATTHP